MRFPSFDHFLIIALSVVICASCASGPYRRSGGTLRLMFDRDMVEILMAHCEAGVLLADAVQSLDVPEPLKARAAQMSEDEKRDLSTLSSWVRGQVSQPSQAGAVPAAEVRSEHVASANALKTALPANQAIQAERVLDQHLREEKIFIEETPVKDRQLRDLVLAIWQRLSAEKPATSRGGLGGD